MAMGIVVVERPGTNQKYENNRKVIKIIVEKKPFGPFLWMGFNSSRLEALWGGSLLFTTKLQMHCSSIIHGHQD